MKKIYTRKLTVTSFALLLSIVTGFSLLSDKSYGQTYYSKFTDPTNRAYTLNPQGTSCNVPAVVDSLGFADTAAATFASFTLTRSAEYTCNTNFYYHFLSNLNLPSDTPTLGAGFKAGFRIRIPSGISLDSLRKYTVISTYTSSNGQLVESEYNENIFGSDSTQTGVDWYLYFMPTKPFNTVEINVDPNIATLNKSFEFDVLYAFASKDLVLPATIDNFKASVAGKNVNLSFQSLTETNVATYRIERSNNGGASYSVVGSLVAKGNSNVAVPYGFTDNASVDGSYLYRIVIVNKDGTSKASNSLAVVINGQDKLLLYPSVVRAGQNVTIKTSAMGMVTLQLFDAQGRLVKQQRTNSEGQLTVPTGSLGAGVYVVKLIAANNNVQSTKMVIR